nr:hypothetical protein [Tanacetum cinerariifolium]
VGYTNDEKSTLLEQLPMANILAEDRLFAFQELHEIRALPTTPIGKECRFSSGDTFTINHKDSFASFSTLGYDCYFVLIGRSVL